MNTEANPLHVPPPRTNKLAVTSLVLGILSLLLCFVGFVFAIPGLICGIMGMGRVKNSGGAQTGHGLALAGTILCGVALLLSPLLLAISVPNFIKARDAAQRAGCQMQLQAIQQAKVAWASQNGKAQSAVPGDADLFGPGKSMQQRPNCPKGGTYSLNAVDSPATCSIPSHNN